MPSASPLRAFLRRCSDYIFEHPKLSVSIVGGGLASWVLRRLENLVEDYFDQWIEQYIPLGAIWAWLRMTLPVWFVTLFGWLSANLLSIGIILPLGYIAFVMWRVGREESIARRGQPGIAPSPSPHDAVVRPHLVLRSVEPKQRTIFVASQIGAQFEQKPVGTVWCLYAEFYNDPIRRESSAEASGVIARLGFWGADKRTPLISGEIDGRWADTEQPGARGPFASYRDLQQADFEVSGLSRTLDIAVAFNDGTVSATNNEHHLDPNYRPFHVEADRFAVRVHLTGPHVDEAWWITVAVELSDNPSASPFHILSVEEEAHAAPSRSPRPFAPAAVVAMGVVALMGLAIFLAFWGRPTLNRSTVAQPTTSQLAVLAPQQIPSVLPLEREPVTPNRSFVGLEDLIRWNKEYGELHGGTSAPVDRLRGKWIERTLEVHVNRPFSGLQATGIDLKTRVVFLMSFESSWIDYVKGLDEGVNTRVRCRIDTFDVSSLSLSRCEFTHEPADPTATPTDTPATRVAVTPTPSMETTTVGQSEDDRNTRLRLWGKHKKTIQDALPKREGCRISVISREGRPYLFDLAQDFAAAIRDVPNWDSKAEFKRLDAAEHQITIRANAADWIARNLAGALGQYKTTFDVGLAPAPEMEECHFVIEIRERVLVPGSASSLAVSGMGESRRSPLLAPGPRRLSKEDQRAIASFCFQIEGTLVVQGFQASLKGANHARFEPVLREARGFGCEFGCGRRRWSRSKRANSMAVSIHWSTRVRRRA